MFGTAVVVPSQDELQLELVQLVTAVVPAKACSVLLKELYALEPMGELKHLKRVRKCPEDSAKLEAVLCAAGAAGAAPGNAAPPSTSAGPEAGSEPPQASVAAVGHGMQGSEALSMDSLPPQLAQLARKHGVESLRTAHGSLRAPQTREQWEEWTKAWPITWRIPENGTAIIAEEPVAAELQRYFEPHMQRALQLARGAGVANAALLVDPATNIIIAEAADRSSGALPLHHAAMCVVEAASQRDLLLWPDPAPPPPDGSTAAAPTTTLADQHEEATGREGGGDGGAQLDDDRRGGRGGCATEGEAEGDGGELARKRQRVDAAAAASAGPGPGSRAGSAPPASKPYMCTGYDFFTVCEPCIMCAMGLVHSRVQRVVYCQSDPQHGALGGKLRLHACRTLNHNYQVFRMPLLPASDVGGAGAGVGPA